MIVTFVNLVTSGQKINVMTQHASFVLQGQ